MQRMLSLRRNPPAPETSRSVRTAPPLKDGAVTDFAKSSEDNKTWYRLDLVPVNPSMRPYSIWRRFEDFVELNASLIDLVRISPVTVTLPPLPKKRMWGFMTKAVCEERKQVLDQYVKALMLGPAFVLNSAVFSEFFGTWKQDQVDRAATMKRKASIRGLKAAAERDAATGIVGDVPLDEPWLAPINERRLSVINDTTGRQRTLSRSEGGKQPSPNAKPAKSILKRPSKPSLSALRLNGSGGRKNSFNTSANRSQNSSVSTSVSTSMNGSTLGSFNDMQIKVPEGGYDGLKLSPNVVIPKRKSSHGWKAGDPDPAVEKQIARYTLTRSSTAAHSLPPTPSVPTAPFDTVSAYPSFYSDTPVGSGPMSPTPSRPSLDKPRKSFERSQAQPTAPPGSSASRFLNSSTTTSGTLPRSKSLSPRDGTPPSRILGDPLNPVGTLRRSPSVGAAGRADPIGTLRRSPSSGGAGRARPPSPPGVLVPAPLPEVTAQWARDGSLARARSKEALIEATALKSPLLESKSRETLSRSKSRSRENLGRQALDGAETRGNDTLERSSDQEPAFNIIPPTLERKRTLLGTLGRKFSKSNSNNQLKEAAATSPSQEAKPESPTPSASTPDAAEEGYIALADSGKDVSEESTAPWNRGRSETPRPSSPGGTLLRKISLKRSGSRGR
ncbi:hypothetical protein HK104_004188, partial [Borealophlyctis nickersoniae]